MLKRRISKSRKFAALKNDKSRVLYLLLLPFTDVEGRFEADLSIIKGSVCPYVSSLTTRNIAACLSELHHIGLIILYENEGEKYLQVQRFHDFNNVNPAKEAESHIPPPTPAQLQRNSGATPAEVKLREVKEKLSKEKYKDSVFLSLEEYKKLTDRFGQKVLDSKIEDLDNYQGSTGKKYKDHYKTLLGWLKKDFPDQQKQRKLCFVPECLEPPIHYIKAGVELCEGCKKLYDDGVPPMGRNKPLPKAFLDKGQIEVMIQNQKAKRS